MPTDQSKIVEIPIQLPGEVKPMTRSEREYRRKHADKLRRQAEQLTDSGRTVTLKLTLNTISDKKPTHSQTMEDL